MSEPFETAHIDELESFPVDDEGLTWRPVRRRFGIQAFGTNAYTAERVGQRVVEEHRERDNHEELYVVLSGRATFTLEGDEVDAPAGTLVHCPPGTLRGAVAAEPRTTVLAVGAKPGVAYEPSPWEPIFVAGGYARLGDLERARETLRAVTDEHPDAWQGWFNWACIEARFGDRDAALQHLQRAASLDGEAVREWAPKDSDLDSLRDDPRYSAIAGQP